MSATCHELFDSRQISTGGGSPTATLKYIVITSIPSLESDVMTAVRGAAPLLFQGMFRQTINVAPIGGPNWTADVGYAIPDDGGNLDTLGEQGGAENPGAEQSEPDTTAGIGPEYSFSTGGGTKNVLQSIETQYMLAPATDPPGGLVAPDFGKFINASMEGVNGVDIVAPNFEFSYTRLFRRINLNYIRLLALYTGSVNDDTFYGFEKGELLFLGADGSCKPNDEPGTAPTWSITFRFAVNRNRENVVVKAHTDPGPPPTGGIIVPLVRGWEYLWVTQAVKPDLGAAPAAIIRVPFSAYVEQVYEYRNFRNLGI